MRFDMHDGRKDHSLVLEIMRIEGHSHHIYRRSDFLCFLAFAVFFNKIFKSLFVFDEPIALKINSPTLAICFCTENVYVELCGSGVVIYTKNFFP